MIEPNPKRCFDLTLDLDESLPLKKRPTFRCRYVTIAEAQAMADVLAALQDDAPDSNTAWHQQALDVLRPIVVSWRNLTAKALEDALTILDLVELLQRIPVEAQTAEADAKKSIWQSRAAGANAARTARRPNAGTSPAK